MRLLESRNRAEEELVSPRSLLLLSPRIWASTPKLARSITRSTARVRRTTNLNILVEEARPNSLYFHLRLVVAARSKRVTE